MIYGTIKFLPLREQLNNKFHRRLNNVINSKLLPISCLEFIYFYILLLMRNLSLDIYGIYLWENIYGK